jgi:hypothetical protein
MTQGWRGEVDTSSLGVRALACAVLLLAIGALGPKRQRAPHGAAPRTTLENTTARTGTVVCPGVAARDRNGQTTED